MSIIRLDRIPICSRLILEGMNDQMSRISSSDSQLVGQSTTLKVLEKLIKALVEVKTFTALLRCAINEGETIQFTLVRS